MSKNTFELPWYYRQVPRDFMSSPDVTMMTAEEIGSYFLLLQCAWLGGQNCTLLDLLLAKPQEAYHSSCIAD
jgi:hypothetical protein